jgi:thiol-disulfide isomerase/thioredoxin
MLDRAQKILVELTRLEQEAEANPEDPAKALILGNGYLALKRPASAIPWLERALAGKGVLERKARAAATYNLGVAHLQNGTFDKGIAQFEAFQITFGPGPQADKAAELVEIGRYLWAGARVKAGETAEAQALYERLVKESRNKGLVEDVRQRLFTLKAVGRAAPGLQVSDWIKGGPTTLQKLKGKVVLLDFFQIICPGCRRAHPHILEMQKKYGPQGLQVLGIAVAFEQQHVQTKRHIRDYVKETKFTFPVAIDKDFTATFSAYGARGTPYVAILDRRGRVRHLGFYNPIEVERLLRAVLAEEGSQPAPGGER